MRPRCSLYVDVGYLLSATAVRVTGTSFRNGIQVDYESLIDALVQQAEALSGLPVLRVHWYDSARDGVPDNQQQFIGELSNVKLRLGRFGREGQQKGVDLRIGLDLVTHARNGAADVFILVSGDDDLTEAVEEAQVHGVQVILLAVPDATDKPHAISRHLIRAADGLKTIFPETIDQTVTKIEVQGWRPRPKPAPLLEPGGTMFEDQADLTEQIDSVVSNVLATFRRSATAEALTELVAGRPSIPRDIDKALLTDLSDRRGGIDLNELVRHKLRTKFWEKYDEA
ncbi:NYN domain-containing protein [Actinoplanes sp. Pm04-4]|uniref:NYN domain-containing protein n=1 Tax=Paractinoplanes pyxinae TaxID=2997416 RepID=A0ABT4AS52_9ACTN|nr:NYN domain-containing protein [Actinoplanes pyxinae]MCY1137059.1 NYN domain-containing protein [Actinoplanes pyxinae]